MRRTGSDYPTIMPMQTDVQNAHWLAIHFFAAQEVSLLRARFDLRCPGVFFPWKGGVPCAACFENGTFVLKACLAPTQTKQGRPPPGLDAERLRTQSMTEEPETQKYLAAWTCSFLPQNCSSKCNLFTDRASCSTAARCLAHV